MEKRLNPTDEEKIKNKNKDAETLERALSGMTLQLFQDFEEDSPEDAAQLKVQLLQMVTTGMLKKDETITEAQMTRMIGGMSSKAEQPKKSKWAPTSRRRGCDSEDSESDSDLM